MGLQDREYYRDETPPKGLQFNVQTMVAKLVLVNAVLFVVDMLSSGRLFEYMQVNPTSLTDVTHIWQLVTYGFAHGNPFHILFNMFALWMFGREVEERRGGTEFLIVYLVTLVLGSVFWCGRNLLSGYVPNEDGEQWKFLVGASGAVSAVVMLFILANPKRRLLLFFVYPIPAWAVGALVIVLNIVGTRSKDNVAYDVHLVGIAFAFLYFYSGLTFDRLIPGCVSSTAGKLKAKPALKVHDPEAYYADLDAEADRILDKVHREGESSLNRRERKILKDYSRRMRQKHQ